MAGTGDPFLDEIIARRSQFGLNTGGGAFDPWPEFEAPEGFQPSQALAATATQDLPNAQPQDDTGWSALDQIFDFLDIPGAAVRGGIGSLLSLLQGKFGEAGERFLSAFPGSEAVPTLVNEVFGTKIPELRAPTGEDLLVDLGMPRGSTSEDEQRIRVAIAAGMNEREARKKFTAGDKRLSLEKQAEFDELVRQVAESNPDFDFGVNWGDTKKAIDVGDFAGLGVDILTDPLTYMTFGLSGAGQLAKALKEAEKAAPGLKALLKVANSADDAKNIVRAAKLPKKQIGRLESMISKSFKPGMDLDLGETMAEQAARKQRGIANLPQFLGGEPLISGEKGFAYLGKIGETDIARSAKGLEPGSPLQEKLRDFYQPLRSMFSKKTGLGDLDEAIEGGKVAQRTGLTKADRELDRIAQEVRSYSKLSQRESMGVVRTLTESGNFGEHELGPLAAGIAKINKEIADKSLRFNLPFNELDDETLRYLRREITPEGKEFLDKNGSKGLRDFAGLEYSAKGRYLMAREEKWKGKTIAEINEYMREKHGVKEFFHEDPVFATRRMVRQAQRAIGNAVMAEELVKRFAMDGPGKYTVLDLHNALGLKVFNDTTEMKQMRKMAEQYEKLAAKAQKNINSALKAGTGDMEVLKEGARQQEFMAATGKQFADAAKQPILDAREKLKNMVIPDEIYKFAVRNRELLDKPNLYLKGYKAITDWMKATVTVLFPAFHGRNMLENTFKNASEGNVNPKNYIDAGKLIAAMTNVNAGGPGMMDDLARKAKSIFQKQGDFSAELKQLFKEAGIGDNIEDVVDWMSANGILENRVTSELGAVLRDAPQGKPSSTARQAFEATIGQLGTGGVPVKAGMAVASGTENWHRVSLFLDRLRKGFSAAEAAEEVKRVFFDYRDLTAFESKYMQRFGFFYNFYRNNLRYITQQALEHPVRSKLILDMFRDDPDDPRFRWLSNKGALKLGAADVSLGFLPQQQFNMFNLAEGDVFDKVKGKGGQLIGQANPMINNALNLFYSHDLFTNTPLEYKTRVADIGEAPEAIRKMFGYEQTADGNAKISHKWNFAINAIPALGRLMQSVLSWQQKDKDYVQKFSRFLTGISITDKDATELGKRDLELLNRNIEREAKQLSGLRETGKATYSIDTSTREGKLMSALATPTSAEIKTLLLDQEIAGRILPMISFKGDKPVMNRLLADTLDQIWHDRYPAHAALFDAQKLRRKVKLSTKDNVELEADEEFEKLFGEIR